MALSNNYRKLSVDSRWRVSSDHSDFVIELPDDCDTTRTSSVYLASCSFANTFETVLPGINDTLYAALARHLYGSAAEPAPPNASAPSSSARWPPRGEGGPWGRCRRFRLESSGF